MNHGERVIYRAVYDSPIGLLTLTALDDALGALSFPRERYPKDAELLKAGKEVCIPQKDRLPAERYVSVAGYLFFRKNTGFYAGSCAAGKRV